MLNRKGLSLFALIAAAMIFPVTATAQPWPEAHSGSYLGVQISAVNPQQVSALKLQDATGALVTYVDQDGPACHAGLLRNDVIVAFEGSKVDNPQQLQGLIHATPPQKSVTLTVMRSGQRKDMKVTLGSWNIMSHVRAMPALPLAAPPPPHAYVPDVEVPSFTLLSSRHGLVVESLSPQLADFFGVPHGHGVLVRSVEAGSPAAAAGLKAGDVILQMNNEPVHDMADWQRGLHGSRVSVNIWRDKREQKLVMSVPGPGDSSRLLPGDWLDRDTNAQLLREEMERMTPEFESSKDMMAQLGPSEKQLEQLRHDIEKSMKAQQNDMQKMSRDLAKSAKPCARDMEKMRTEIQNSVPTQQDFADLTRQIQQSLPSPQQFEAMKQQVQASIPTRQQMDEMRKQIEESTKAWTPQLQHEMEQLQKQMEQNKLDLQQMMRDMNNRGEN